MYSSRAMEGEIASFMVSESLAVAGARIGEIDFPHEAAVLLVLRHGQPLAARGGTRLMPNDHVYVFFRAADRPFVELLFGRPER